ncbi:phosphatase PAP2 family protein [Mycobacterium sp. CVI_P3]|uniref:Phosphatase PAP2 family protein n=1 Tax=Mycobacterium pinniadriaticum TaxID=2994102 RepID=A0ABT3SJE4_9MYCO|nr:phosphatase PAP2 family protein [Mycobacterium pinniadriaticum]MCX2932609.1 phosphatase PAP2 family protein [Mycobacterium pinniadriaticum]MCX2938947.1 phosphatase PAP2 family protein [Mycobacterium pinniadriaticum]
MASKKFWLIVSAAIAALVYAAMWVGYLQNWAWLDTVDTQMLQAFHTIGASRPGWVSFWTLFCAVFGPNGFRLLALVLLIVALLRRNVLTALFLVLSIGLMGMVTEGAKSLADRPRPATALVYASSTSFPSGHALGAMVGVLALLTVLWPSLTPGLRAWLGVLGGVLIVLVGLARVVLNVHHPSDVLAGWALGYLYYLVCLQLVPRPETGVLVRLS